jgi:hypothetical protein
MVTEEERQADRIVLLAAAGVAAVVGLAALGYALLGMAAVSIPLAVLAAFAAWIAYIHRAQRRPGQHEEKEL